MSANKLEDIVSLCNTEQQRVKINDLMDAVGR